MEEKLIDIRLTPSFINTDKTDTKFIEDLFNRLKGWTKRGLETPEDENGIKREYVIKQYVIGKEKLDKYGRETHLHYHIALILLIEKTSIQTKALIKEYLRRNGAKGNPAYMVRVNEDVKDEDRWFRYSMKQLDYESDKKGHELLAKLANDEYKRQVQQNLESEEAQRKKHQFRDKLWKHLDEKKLTGDQEIAKAMFDFYNQNGRDAPIFELQSKVLNYQICRNIKQFSEIYKFWK